MGTSIYVGSCEHSVFCVCHGFFLQTIVRSAPVITAVYIYLFTIEVEMWFNQAGMGFGLFWALLP